MTNSYEQIEGLPPRKLSAQRFDTFCVSVVAQNVYKKLNVFKKKHPENSTEILPTESVSTQDSEYVYSWVYLGLRFQVYIATQTETIAWIYTCSIYKSI